MPGRADDVDGWPCPVCTDRSCPDCVADREYLIVSRLARMQRAREAKLSVCELYCLHGDDEPCPRKDAP